MDNKDIIIENQANKIAELTNLVQSLTEANRILTETNKVLSETVKQLQETIKELQDSIKDLKSQLNQNSQNSSKPPSTDGFQKPKPQSLREKSGKKPGGQKGHKGSHMTIPHSPDEVKEHFPDKCASCPHLQECILNGSVFSCGEKRYVVDAVFTTKVTEHQKLSVTSCPCSGEALSGNFPDTVRAHVQYGDSVSVLVGLLNTCGAVSDMRIHDILGSVLNISLSPATITKMVSRCANNVEGTLDKIKSMLIGAKVVHFDETGADVNGKTIWIHNSSNDKLTYQTINQHRGQIGISDNGVICEFKGVAVHDCWSSYWMYHDAMHAVCNAHLLRELTGVEQYSPEHKWASEFKTLLRSMKKAKERTINHGKPHISRYFIHKFSQEYDRLMKLANEECPAPTNDSSDKKKGRKKKGKERSLIERLISLRESICLFVMDFDVPFDNNQAERDIRNVKTKMKVSGCFRTEGGAKDYLNIMSYLSTARKHGIGAYAALTSAFAGNADMILN